MGFLVTSGNRIKQIIMSSLNEAIQGMEEPSRSIIKTLVEFYDNMKELETDPDKEGKQAVAVVMAMNDIETVLDVSVSRGNYAEIHKPYIQDADTIEIDGGLYVVAGRASKCYIPIEDLVDIIHISN